MKRFFAVLVAAFAVSSAWADYVYLYMSSETGENYEVVVTPYKKTDLSGHGYNSVTGKWHWYVYNLLGESSGPPEWMEKMGVKDKVTFSNVTFDEKGNVTGYEMNESYDLSDIPWSDWGMEYKEGMDALDPDTVSYNGITLEIDDNGWLSYDGNELCPLVVKQSDTGEYSDPRKAFDNIAGIKDTVLDADASYDSFAEKHEGLIAFTGTSSDGSEKTHYFDPYKNLWVDWNGESYVIVDPWGLSSSSGGGSSGGGDGGGSSSGGGSSGGGDGGGSSSGGGDGGGSSSGGGDGGGSSSGGDGGDDGGDDDTGSSGEDWEYDYRSVLQSINSGVSSVANQATVSNGTLTNIEGGLTDLAGEYVETDGASAVTSSDGSALSSASSSGLSGVSGTLDGVGADVSSGWSDVSANLFGWVDGFSKLPPSVLSMGSFKINLLGVQKDVNLDVNLSSVSDWLVLIRRALILLWGAITLFVVFRLFRWLTAEIVKGIRWLLGVIPKAFSIVATGA